MKSIFIFVSLLINCACFAQTRMIVVGDVKDAATNQPLAYATVGVKFFTDQAVSNAEGKFELSLPADAIHDTLVVSYVGYQKFEKAVRKLASVEHVLLTEHATVLDEVTIVHRQLDLRQVDRGMKLIRGTLYAAETEVSNANYHDFLSWLEDYNKTELRKKYDFNLDAYPKSVKEFYNLYHKPSTGKKSRKDTVQRFDNSPAVNITYEAAVEYCKWLTERYNESPRKKKFKKVKFRLPTLNEWQIAALGDPKFQSWNLEENMVETMITKDSSVVVKGDKKMISVNDRVWYPWYRAYWYRDKVNNMHGCYLGNFRIEPSDAYHCPAKNPAYDGFAMMSHIASYFPNYMGLFDVVGNVAEMIDEKGKACGGSWNDRPVDSTIHSVKTYNGPDETVGFRLFMDVLEK